MTNDLMLELVREDRSAQTIHNVISFTINDYGFYDVVVDMMMSLGEITTNHAVNIIPYPIAEYEKLSERERYDLYNIFK